MILYQVQMRFDFEDWKHCLTTTNLARARSYYRDMTSDPGWPDEANARIIQSNDGEISEVKP